MTDQPPAPSPPAARTLPPRPHLDQLKRQAKELLDAFRAGDAAAAAEVRRHHRAADPATLALHDAQRILARAYGFDSWPKLKAHVDGVNTTRLCDAVLARDLPGVRSILRQRPELVNMERPGHGEQRALHLAVLHNDATMVRLLMDHGADAQIGIYPHRDATSALTLARDRGLDELVAIMQQAEQRRREEMSCPNATVSPAQDELNDAIRRGDDAPAIALLESDPTLIRACDRAGRTPLHVAAAALNESMAVWLLEHHADVKRRDASDRTPLDAAVTVGWSNVVDVERFNAVAARLRGRGAELTLRSAVALGEADWLRERHAEAALVNPIESAGGLLTIAVKHDRPDMLALLLDLGLDVDERKRVPGIETTIWSWGMPLWHCAGSGRHAMAQRLLDRGADPNGQVYASGSPVFQAYGQRDARMVELLRQRGGLPDAITVGLYRHTDLATKMLDGEMDARLSEGHFAGETLAEQLLWAAACGGDAEIVRMALQRIDWPRDDGRWYTMLEQPLRLWNHGPGHWADPAGMDRSTYERCFALLLERCDPNIRGRFGRAILHDVAAVRSPMTPGQRVSFASMLLEAGARLDVRDDLLRSTPLGWACRWGRAELVALLLARGAVVDEPDGEPWTQPRAWAKRGWHGEVLALLE
ncbi:MAG: ankyrin repeat domain-containing protein [Phycisphaeraceae bacterium]